MVVVSYDKCALPGFAHHAVDYAVDCTVERSAADMMVQGEKRELDLLC